MAAHTLKLLYQLYCVTHADAIDLKGFTPLRNVLRHLYLEKWPLAAGDDKGDGPEPDLEEIAGMLVRDLSVHPFVYISVHGGSSGAPVLEACTG